MKSAFVGNSIYVQSGIYDTFQTTLGCDSIITSYINFSSPLNGIITQSGNEILLNLFGGYPLMKLCGIMEILIMY